MLGMCVYWSVTPEMSKKDNYALSLLLNLNVNILSSDTFLAWLPSCLHRGALTNVDSPGCGTSVIRGLTGHK